MNCSEFRENLDALIDGELSEELRALMDAHEKDCESCRMEKAAAEQLRDFLSHIDDEVSVPLPAQAAWRSAVRAEARRRSIRRICAAVGTVAAACVLTLSVSSMLGERTAEPTGMPGAVMTKMIDAAPVAYVEADGVSEDARLEASAAPVGRSAVIPYTELKISAEDADAAYGYVCDIASEYGCRIDREAEDSSGRKLYVLVPGENLADFASAVSHVGTDAEAALPDLDALTEMVGVCVVISEN